MLIDGLNYDKLKNFYIKASSYLVAFTLFFSIILKVVYWTNYSRSIQNMFIFSFIPFPNLIAFIIILIEFLIAISLVFFYRKKIISLFSFSLFCAFIVITIIESKQGNFINNCPCFGNIEMPLVSHVQLNIALSCLSSVNFLLLSKVSSRKLILFLVLYLVIINILSISIYKVENNSEFSFEKAYKLNNTLADEEIISTKIKYIFLVNLSNLNCMNCVMTIDTFINILSENEELADKTVVLVTHPDDILGERRCKGWIKNQPLKVKIKYFDFKKIKELNIYNSVLLKYNGGKINSFHTVPFNPYKMLVNLKKMEYVNYNGK